MQFGDVVQAENLCSTGWVPSVRTVSTRPRESYAVVVPGARALQSEKGREWGLSLYAPVIVKYRDEKTDAATQLEELLR